MLGWDYGNARLRARKSRLLGEADYHRLMSVESLDGLVAALADTPYRPDLEAAITRYSGLRRFDEVVRLHLGRVLGAMSRFYEGEDGEFVGLLVERWELVNLRAIIRGHARFRRAGYFIGSGTVESAGKQIAGMRLKRAGARWTENGAVQTAKARAAWLSDDWDALARQRAALPLAI